MKFLITGGAGFIGSNCAAYFLQTGHQVRILDNLSRNSAKFNLASLEEKFGKNSFELLTADVRSFDQVSNAVAGVDVVIHLAGQVAVTSSVLDPRSDFEINATGTFNILEAARKSKNSPFIIFASTNKVYGEIENIEVVELASRYAYSNLPNGVSELQPLSFHSPYGCSKGAADQYVHDYSRIYEMQTVVFRLSCIYGPHQLGTEDQGWLSWFIFCNAKRQGIKIYGNGKQVRDILYISDLISAFEKAILKKDQVSGQVFNLGGGVNNSISIWLELKHELAKFFKQASEVTWGEWRPGDQKIYISDNSKAQRLLAWTPQVSYREGIEKLYHWVDQNFDDLQSQLFK